MKKVITIDGFIMTLVTIVLAGFFGLQLLSMVTESRQLFGETQYPIWGSIWRFIVIIFLIKGFQILGPNDVSVLTFFGEYQGCIDRTGFSWTLPWYGEYDRLSKAIETYESNDIKALDKDGSPITTRGVVKYRIADPYKAAFEVGSLDDFVSASTDGAFRELANSHTYGEVQKNHSLADQTLKNAINTRFAKGGLIVEDVDVVDFSYATEIASQMLQTQGAQAVVNARKVIAQGAVNVVEETINQLKDKGIQFTDTQKADFATKLVLVIVGENKLTPTINI